MHVYIYLLWAGMPVHISQITSASGNGLDHTAPLKVRQKIVVPQNKQRNPDGFLQSENINESENISFKNVCWGL